MAAYIFIFLGLVIIYLLVAPLVGLIAQLLGGDESGVLPALVAPDTHSLLDHTPGFDPYIHTRQGPSLFYDYGRSGKL